MTAKNDENERPEPPLEQSGSTAPVAAPDKNTPVPNNKKRLHSEIETPRPGKAAETSSVASSDETMPLLTTSLYRMTDGIPQRELKLIVSEAQECIKELEAELQALTEALAGDVTESSASASSSANTTPASVDAMLESEVTPPDQHWTLSALLGRLRRDLTTPLPPNSQLPAHRENAGLQHLANAVPKKKKMNTPGSVSPAPNAGTTATTTTTTQTSLTDRPDGGTGLTADEANGGGPITSTTASTTGISGRSTPLLPTPLARDGTHFQRLAQLQDDVPEYVVEHPDTERLLALWKKISTHRASLVFRRPVNPKEAPGYADRIFFPMDLSLIRKLIVSRVIKNYKGVAQQIHLICHNCVKYNGRESDYALVAREFESVASEYIFSAVCNHATDVNVGVTTTKGDETTPTTVADGGTPAEPTNEVPPPIGGQ